MNQVWWGEVAVHAENSTELGLKQAEIDASALDESNIARRQFNTNDREWPFRPVIGIELPQTYSHENSTLVLILRVRATVAKRHPFSYEMVPAPEVYERRPIRVASRADSQIYRLLFAMALIGPTLALGGTGLLHWRCNLRLQNGPKPDVQILASARVESAPDSRGHFSWKEFRAGQSIEFDA